MTASAWACQGGDSMSRLPSLYAECDATAHQARAVPSCSCMQARQLHVSSLKLLAGKACVKPEACALVVLVCHSQAHDINALFGFRLECLERLGDEQGVFVWRRINELFNFLPLAASIEGKILCMHGGIGRWVMLHDCGHAVGSTGAVCQLAPHWVV